MKVSRVVVAGAAIAGTLAPGALGSGAPTATATEPEEQLACWTYALTAEEIADGVTSVIECEPASQAAQERATHAAKSGAGLMSTVLARHFWSANGTGSFFDVFGVDCNGGGISFAAGDPWNDNIRSTEHRICGTVKYWEHAGNSGASEYLGGSPWQIRNLTTLAGYTSAVQYYA